MKTTIFLSLVLALQFSFAQKPPARELKRLTTEQAREKSKNSIDYIEKLRREGKSLLTDPVAKKAATTLIDSIVKDVTVLSSEQNEGLKKLIEIAPSKVLPKIVELASIVKDPSSSAVEKSQAKKGIELVSLSSKDVNVKSIFKNAAEQNTAELRTAKILELSEKVASIASGELAAKSADFVKKYEAALKEGKSIEDAVTEASGGKFSLDDILNCK